MKPFKQDRTTRMQEFPLTRLDWEEQVFRKATYFTVIRFLGQGHYARQEFKTFSEAVYFVENAGAIGIEMMIYAVTVDRHDACLERAKWHDLMKIWNEKAETSSA